MVLVIDVGNTNIKIGAFEGKTLLGSWRMSSDVRETSDEYGLALLSLLAHGNITTDSINGIIISSVIPSLNYTLEHTCRHYLNCEPMFVGRGLKTKINIKYDNPKEVGADRIVNCVAAYEKYGGPCVVVDFGTATTLSIVNAEGEFAGGCICPGLKMSIEALTQRTSKLPRIELAFPKNIIGKSTVTGMQSGALYGHVGQVDYLIAGIKEEIGEAFVVATGGMSSLITEKSKQIDKADALLTLEGLRILYEWNV